MKEERITAIEPVSAQTWQVIQSVAPVVQAARMFGVTQEQAAVVMLKGHELGLGLASAFEYIHVIDGKPGLSPKGALALIHQSGVLAKLQIEDLQDDKGAPAACRVTMKRHNGFEYTCKYSMADAQRAGLVKQGSGWDKYPANMLRWRTIGYCADVVCPDVGGGLYRTEEIGGDITPDGRPLQVIDAPTRPRPQTASVDAAPLTIQDLLNAGYTAEQIVVANEGVIPSTSEQCEAVLIKLEAS